MAANPQKCRPPRAPPPRRCYSASTSSTPGRRQDFLLLASYNESGEGRIVVDDGSCIAEFFILPKETKGRLLRQIRRFMNLCRDVCNGH
ncbi:unnamed protein product [Urochloa humidicola]